MDEHKAEMERSLVRAVHQASAMNNAMHDAGPWRLAYGHQEVKASRIIDAARGLITFEGEIGEHCYLVPPEPWIYLLLRGDVVDARNVPSPGDGPFLIRWEYRVREASALA